MSKEETSITQINRVIVYYVFPIILAIFGFWALLSYWWFDRYSTTLTVTAPINVMEKCTRKMVRSPYGDPVAEVPMVNPSTYKCGLVRTNSGNFALPKSGFSIFRHSRASMLEKLELGGTYHAVFYSPNVAPDQDGRFLRNGKLFGVSPPPTILRLVATAE